MTGRTGGWCGEHSMLSAAFVLIACVVVFAALIDVHDSRRGRKLRDAMTMATERRDLAADMAATQHRGIHSPIGDICRDRQRSR